MQTKKLIIKNLSVSVRAVAVEFTKAFIEDIDKRREEIIEILSSKESDGKLSMKEDEVRVVLFYALLAFWTLPLFNLFSQDQARDVFRHVCELLASALEIDVLKLEKMTLEFRDHYNSTIVENMKLMKGSAWLVDGIVDEPDMFTYMQIDALLADSMVFNWKKLSEEYIIR